MGCFDPAGRAAMVTSARGAAAGAFVVLASDVASCNMGQVLPVYGGMVI